MDRLTLPKHLRAVVFDAVGTLIHPQPTAAQVYAEVGQHFGSGYSYKEIATRFSLAFHRQEMIDREANWQTSEARELARWRRIVAEVLDDVQDPESCFSTLYDHFARPNSWRCGPQVETLLPMLSKQGLKVGIASNFDARLSPLIAELAPLRSVEAVVISSQVGWRKPAAGFFAAVQDLLAIPSEGILFVGDDPQNDFEGARAAGMEACLVVNGDLKVALASVATSHQ